MHPRPGARVAPVVCALVLGACAPAPAPATGADAGQGDASDTVLRGEVVVLAASSLRGVFTELGALLESEHPEVTVTFSFAASSTLAEQVVQGVPADVLATADATTMAHAETVTAEPQVFAHNSMVIVTPPGNPGRVTGLADLAEPELVVAVCAPEVPCGAAAARLFTAAGVEPEPDAYESDVGATLAVVTMGEVDAALVYRTDALAAGAGVTTIEVPGAEELGNDDEVAVVDDAANPEAASAFVALLTSPRGQEILTAAGFDPA